MKLAVPYRLSCKQVINKKDKKSLIDTSAYNAREKLKDYERDTVFDYSYKKDLLFKKLFLPSDAPEWANNRESLWNNVIRYEKRQKAQLAKLWEATLPHQITVEKMIEVIEKFVTENFTNNQIVVDVALHDAKNGNNNYHIHFLHTLRKIDANGFTGNKLREWYDIELLKSHQKSLAEICANALKDSGYPIEAEQWRHGYLDLKQQRELAINRGDYNYANNCNHKPTTHKGVKRHYIENKKIKMNENYYEYDNDYSNQYQHEHQNKNILSNYETHRNEFLNNYQHIEKVDEFILEKFSIIFSADTKVGDYLDEENKEFIYKQLKKEKEKVNEKIQIHKHQNENSNY